VQFSAPPHRLDSPLWTIFVFLKDANTIFCHPGENHLRPRPAEMAAVLFSVAS
jgi:hypothetical protein